MSQFVFGGTDLTDWIEHVSIREEYEAVTLTRGVQALGGLLGDNQPTFWRIRAEGYAFGDTVPELRARLASLRQRGVQNLRWQSDRYTRALLTDFRVDEWQGGILLMPNVQLEFIALPFAYGAEQSLAINYPTQSDQLVWTTDLLVLGEYETGLILDYTFTLNATTNLDVRFYWGASVINFRVLRWTTDLIAGTYQWTIDAEIGFVGLITPTSGGAYIPPKGLYPGRLPVWNPAHGLLQVGLRINPLPASGSFSLRYRPKHKWL